MNAVWEPERREQPLQGLLQNLGVNRIAQQLDSIAREGIAMLQRAASGDEGPAFAHAATYSSVTAPPLKQETQGLVIDVGGSHTKVALGSCGAEGQKLELLFDKDHAELMEAGIGGSSMENYAAAVMQEAARLCRERGVSPDSVGIVWSNAQQNVRLDPAAGVRGVTAVVVNKDNGISYRKGEPFLPDLHDGDDIGAIFTRAAREAGLRLKVCWVANDTPAVLKATRAADAGMVACTGANATDVDAAGMIFNTEMGGMWPIPSQALSLGDHVLIADRRQAGREDCRIKVEDLIAGGWLPRVVEGHILAAAEAGHTNLGQLAAYLHVYSTPDHAVFNGPLLTELLKRRELSFEKIPEHLVPKLESLLSGQTREDVRLVADALVRRGGRLAAAMAYAALFHQLQRKDEVLLSLDSTQAKYLPGYLESMEQELNRLAHPKRVRIELQVPAAGITVPMRGLLEMLAEEANRG